MTFNVAVGLEGLEDKNATDKRGQSCMTTTIRSAQDCARTPITSTHNAVLADALFLADTVQIVESSPPEIFTDKAPKAWTEVSSKFGARKMSIPGPFLTQGVRVQVSYHLNDEEESKVKVNTGRRGKLLDWSTPTYSTSGVFMRL